MARQSLLWTALPNGYSDDGESLRVTVLVSPRLEAETDPEQLGTFPDFEVWPATVAGSSFTIRYGGAAFVTIAGNDTSSPSRVDTSVAPFDSAAWTALLPATAFVEGFEFQDMVAKQVLSFPAASIDALVQSLYTSLAASAGEQLPKVSDFLADPGWQSLVASVARNDRAFANSDVGVRDPQRQFEAFTKEQFGQLPAGAKDLALLQLFHTPPSTPQIDGYAVGPESVARQWFPQLLLGLFAFTAASSLGPRSFGPMGMSTGPGNPTRIAGTGPGGASPNAARLGSFCHKCGWFCPGGASPSPTLRKRRSSRRRSTRSPRARCRGGACPSRPWLARAAD